jgi:hypothetical protein
MPCRERNNLISSTLVRLLIFILLTWSYVSLLHFFVKWYCEIGLLRDDLLFFLLFVLIVQTSLTMDSRLESNNRNNGNKEEK